MPVIAQNWYDLNSVRPYPLHDSATRTSDTGERLPNDIIVDLRLSFPNTLGNFAGLASCSVTGSLVSLVFGAASNLDDTPAPVASLTLEKPVDLFRPHALSPLYDGVAGWVVLGEGTVDRFSGRFSTLRQGLLCSRAAEPYRPSPLVSVGKQGVAPPLAGLVRLMAGNDIEIVREKREIPGHRPYPPTGGNLRDVIVIRLRKGKTAEETKEILDRYRGPCEGRPISGTCGDPPPIESINGVIPDCLGNITIYVTGYAIVAGVLSNIAYWPMAILESPVSLSELCAQATPADLLLGFLSESNFLCSVFSISVPSLSYTSLSLNLGGTPPPSTEYNPCLCYGRGWVYQWDGTRWMPLSVQPTDSYCWPGCVFAPPAEPGTVVGETKRGRCVPSDPRCK